MSSFVHPKILTLDIKQVGTQFGTMGGRNQTENNYTTEKQDSGSNGAKQSTRGYEKRFKNTLTISNKMGGGINHRANIFTI